MLREEMISEAESAWMLRGRLRCAGTSTALPEPQANSPCGGLAALACKAPVLIEELRMRTLRVRATGGPVCPLSLRRMRQVFVWPQAALRSPDNPEAVVQGFEIDVDDEPSVAKLRRYLDLESRLSGVRLELIDLGS